MSSTLNQNFIRAAQHGNLREARALLNRGAKINAKDKNGSQAIHRVAEEGSVPALEFLLNRGAKVNALDNNNFQPIHLASMFNPRVVRVLLNRGAKVNARDNYGRQAIHWAASRGHLNTVKLLLRRGANIHARGLYGRQPIHLAAVYGHLPVVKELIKRGANEKNLLNRPMSASVKNYLNQLEKMAKLHTSRRAPLENLAKYMFHPSRVKIPNNIAQTLKKENNRRMKNLNNMRKKNPNIVGTMKIPHWLSRATVLHQKP
jgi:ankyrin repeat protein